MPLISVITASVRPQWLPAAYRSLLEQGDREWEWLVQLDVPETSSDLPHPVAWLDDERVVVERNPTRLGSAVARNSALLRARGQFVLCLDDDDLLAAGALGPLASALDANPDCFGAWGQALTFRDDPNDAVPFRSWPEPGVIEPGTIGRRFEQTGTFDVHVGSVLWRRSHLVAMGGYGGLPRSIDTNPFLACESLFPHVYVDRPVYYYRLHDEQMTRGDHYEAIRERVHRFNFARAAALAELLVAKRAL